jgi:hypothetical protein
VRHIKPHPRLDAVGGPAAEGAADLLVTAGVVAAVPTAASGLNDWSDTSGPETWVGLAHAAVNTTALSLYLVSLAARPEKDAAAVRCWPWPGSVCCRPARTSESTWPFVMGVNVNRTAWERPPHRPWTRLN